jgi:hypothetical protein
MGRVEVVNGNTYSGGPQRNKWSINRNLHKSNYIEYYYKIGRVKLFWIRFASNYP